MKTDASMLGASAKWFSQSLDVFKRGWGCLSFNHSTSLSGTGFFIVFPLDLNPSLVTSTSQLNKTLSDKYTFLVLHEVN